MRADHFNAPDEPSHGYEPDLEHPAGSLGYGSMQRVMEIFEMLCRVFSDETAWHCVPGRYKFVYTGSEFEGVIDWDPESERWCAEAEWVEDHTEDDGLIIQMRAELSISDPDAVQVAEHLQSRTEHLSSEETDLDESEDFPDIF